MPAQRARKYVLLVRALDKPLASINVTMLWTLQHRYQWCLPFLNRQRPCLGAEVLLSSKQKNSFIQAERIVQKAVGACASFETHPSSPLHRASCTLENGGPQRLQQFTHAIRSLQCLDPRVPMPLVRLLNFQPWASKIYLLPGLELVPVCADGGEGEHGSRCYAIVDEFHL